MLSVLLNWQLRSVLHTNSLLVACDGVASSPWGCQKPANPLVIVAITRSPALEVDVVTLRQLVQSPGPSSQWHSSTRQMGAQLLSRRGLPHCLWNGQWLYLPVCYFRTAHMMWMGVFLQEVLLEKYKSTNYISELSIDVCIHYEFHWLPWEVLPSFCHLLSILGCSCQDVLFLEWAMPLEEEVVK